MEGSKESADTKGYHTYMQNMQNTLLPKVVAARPDISECEILISVFQNNPIAGTK